MGFQTFTREPKNSVGSRVKAGSPADFCDHLSLKVPLFETAVKKAIANLLYCLKRRKTPEGNDIFISYLDMLNSPWSNNF